MLATDDLRYTTLPLNNGAGAMPALGFGTLIPDPVATRVATKAALEAGFRLLDTSERYRTETEVGEAMQDVLSQGKIKRADVFVITKVYPWNATREGMAKACEQASDASAPTASICISCTGAATSPYARRWTASRDS